MPSLPIRVRVLSDAHAPPVPRTTGTARSPQVTERFRINPNGLRGLLAVVALVAVPSPAHAFYFLGWPNGPKSPPSLQSPDPNFPSGPPKDSVDPVGPGTGPPTVPGDGEPPVVVTPEPAGAVLAVVGVGVIALRRRLRREPRS